MPNAIAEPSSWVCKPSQRKRLVVGAAGWLLVSLLMLGCQGGGGSASAKPASGGSSGGSTAAPSIESFKATPSAITQGQVATLTWSVSNATALSINQGVGTVTGTSTGVSPTITTAYTLTASNANGSVTATTTLSVGASTGTLNSPRILPLSLQDAASKVASGDPKVSAQWSAFLARLDANLTEVVPSEGIYQGDELEYIPDYALGYRLLKSSDPQRAQKYADKAIGLMKSGLHDFQKGTWIAQQFLARGDGSTNTFTLPNADFDPATLAVTLGPVTTTPVVKGDAGGQDDTGIYYSVFLKLSGTSDGPADYAVNVDWRHNGDWPEPSIDWSLNSGHQPGKGQTYYATSATPLGSSPLSYNPSNPADGTKQVSANVAAHTITIKKAPGAGQAVFVQYSYGTHAADYSSLAYQQTSMGDGGFNSALIDTGYTSRYLGKDMALGYDWLFDYPGFSQGLKSEVQVILGKWYNYYRNYGYYYGSPASNYGAGEYVSALFTMLALKDRSSFVVTDGSAPNMFDGNPILDPNTQQPIALQVEALALRTQELLPILTGAITGTKGIGSLKGGFWSEGWNYGQQATRNIHIAGLALEELGLIGTAQEERTWASEVLTSLIHSQPDRSTIYDGGDWYAYPAPFVDKDLVGVLSFASTDPATKAYASQILQHYAGAPTANYQTFFFNDPNAVAQDWTGSLPLHYLAEGSGLVTARADWTYQSTWMAFQLGNYLEAGHQTDSPGVFQLSRGGDQLLINGNAPNGQQYPKCFSNNVLIDDNGSGETTYRFNSGFWYFAGSDTYDPSSPSEHGCVLNAFEGSADYVYASGDYRAAYYLAGSSSNPARELTRQVMYVRPDAVFVHDRVETTHASFPKLLRWHFIHAPTVSAPSGTATDGSGATWTGPLSYSVASGGSKLFGATFGTAKGSPGLIPLEVPSAATYGQIAPSILIDNECPTNGLPCSDALLLKSSAPTPSTLLEQGGQGAVPVYALLIGNDFTSGSAPTGVRYLSVLQTAPSTTASMDGYAPVFSADGALEGARLGAILVLFGKDGSIPGGFSYGTGTATTPVRQIISDLVPGASYTITVGSGTGAQTLPASGEGVLEFVTTPIAGTSQTITILKN